MLFTVAVRASRSIRSALGHETDIDITDSDAHDMDELHWKATADTKIEHNRVRSGCCH